MSARASASATGLSETELRAWGGFLRAHARLIRLLDAELEAEHGLPLTSFDVLVALAAAPEQRLRMRELADAVVLSRSGLTRLVDRLAMEGLVERASCRDDARGRFAVLTERGRRVLAVAGPTHLRGVRREFLERFSAAELERLGGAWERLGTASRRA